MDLAQLDVAAVADQGAWLTLKHPTTGDDLPVKIKLAGRDSKLWRDAERAYADNRLERMQRNGKIGTIKTADVERRGLRLLATVTMAWENVEIDGKPVQCTKEQAEQLYARFPWIAEQVDEFVGDRSNFLTVAEGEESKQPSIFSAETMMADVAKN